MKDFSLGRIHGFKAFATLLAIASGTASLQAAVLKITPLNPTVSCSTATGSAPVVVNVKPVVALTGVATLTVSIGTLSAGLVATAPALQVLSLSTQAAGINYTVSMAPGCVGGSTGTGTFVLTSTSAPTVVVVNDTFSIGTTQTVAASGLSVPSSVALSCTLSSGPTYTPGAAKTASITSAAIGGTPFSIDPQVSSVPTWLLITPTAGGTASSTPVTLTAVAAAGCGGFLAGTTNTASVQLLNLPGPPKTLTVTLQVFAPSTISFLPAAPSLTYVKGSGTPGSVDVNVSTLVSPAPFFTVDPTSLPTWLSAQSYSGTAPKKLTFTTTSVAETLAQGTLTASITLKVSGFADLLVPVTLLVKNKPSTLSVQGPTTVNMNWTLGATNPTLTITALTSDAPIAYTITTGGTLQPIVAASQLSGLVLPTGTQIYVTFSPYTFSAAQPGQVLTGTVTIANGTQAVVVTINVSVQSAGATVSSLSPATIPTAAPGTTFQITLVGSGFQGGTDLTQKTKVGLVTANVLIPNSNISANVSNASNIILTITVPATSDSSIPFVAGGTVTVGVCNPNGLTCNVPTGIATLSVGTTPIIQTVTSASSFVQTSAPALPSFAAYDLVSVFGTNFCPVCTSSQVLSAVPDPNTLVYPGTLAPDTTHNLTVTFLTHGTSTVLATAPLLFATNGQINLVVPGTLLTGTVDMVVNFATTTVLGVVTGTKSSVAYPVTIAATDPGIFTVGSSGQGDGAILSTTWAVIGAGNPAGMRTTSTSDIIQIYVTGLGIPNSTASNATVGTVGGAVYPTDCVTLSSFLTSLNAKATSSLTTLTGAVIQNSLLNTHRMSPCLTTAPTVTVGGIAATVTYAGWVADSISGLYQINATLPARSASFTTAAGTTVSPLVSAVQLPVVVTANSVSSQAGVTMWVTPSIMVTGPSGAGLTGPVGVAWPSSLNVVAATSADGTAPFRYAISVGVLPSGLTLNSATGVISGTPAANTAGSYLVTAVATDSANIPVSGTVSFTLVVTGGLVVTGTNSPGSGFILTATTAVPVITTIQATGGNYPYTYAITSGAIAGITINPTTGVVSASIGTGATTITPVTVTATDSSLSPAITGIITFNVTIN